MTFSAVPADISRLPEEAKKRIGTCPVYNFTISYQDNTTKTVGVDVDFPKGSVSIALRYTPEEGEFVENIVCIYLPYENKDDVTDPTDNPSTPNDQKNTIIQQAGGIIKGKDGNRFEPQQNVTRAEGSAVLRRFIEVVIDPVDE